MVTEIDEAAPPADTKASSDENDDNLQPAVLWEDPGVYLLSAESVQEIANEFLDRENKKTRLNNTPSIWSALKSLQLQMPGFVIPMKKNRHKFPPHVLAQKSWDAALTNAIIFAMMTAEEQDIERKRYRKASAPDKIRWSRFIRRLHKEKRRTTCQPLDRKKQPKETRTIEKNVDERPLSPGTIEALRDAVNDPKNLEASIAHGTDPERVRRIRQLVGYDPAQAAKHLEQKLKKREEAEKKQTEKANGEKQKKEVRRLFGDPPKSINQQVDSCARKASISAIQQTAKYIQTIHYPNNGNTNQALHSMMLVIYNDVEKTYNPKGGRPKAGKKADVYDLTVVAYDEETCLKIITALTDQYGDRDERFPLPPCTKQFIRTMEGKTLMESAHEFLDADSNQQKRRSRRDVTVCVACNADLNAASYAQLKDKPTAIACTHALCMVCFGQAHVNRSMSADPRLLCLCKTCDHASLVWNIVTYDGTKHLESVEQMIPHDTNYISGEDGEKRPKRRRTKAEMLEMRERYGYVDRAWRRYHGEDFPDYKPRAQIEAEKARRKKFGDPPRTVGGQVDSLARKAVKSSIHMVSKFIQTVHFPGDSDQALHSMALIVYNDVAKQTNAFGGRLSSAKRADYDLTVLAYDNQTCGKIITALVDQFGYRDSRNPRPPCKRQFIQKLEGMTMMESVDTFLEAQK